MISGANSLAQYIIGDIFDWMMQERRSLLEDRWRKNDDAFRGRYDSEAIKKWKATEGREWRSRVFVRLTKQKVVTGYSALLSVLMQNGRIPWDMSPTEVPEAAPGQSLPQEEADIRCARMKKVIQDNFSECRVERQFMTSLMELALHGTSWIRGPVVRPKKVIQRQIGIPGFPYATTPDLLMQYGRYSMDVQTIYKPCAEAVSLWNVFWDLESPNHQDGHGVFIRDMMSYGRFLELMDTPGYDGSAIEGLLERFRSEDAGNVDQSNGPYAEMLSKRKRCIKVYEFWGRVPRRYLEAYDQESMDLSEKSIRDSREVEIYCVLAEGIGEPVVIRSPVVNPLPYRPMYKAVWEEIPYEPTGLGIPENMQDSQMMINGLVRAMLDNKSLSSNLLIKWNARHLAPGQNKLLYPGKVFETADHVDDVRAAVDFFAPPDVTGNTPEIINMFERWADEETGLPKLLQGETARHQPDTAYEMSQLVQGANKSIGATVKNCDEGHIEPLVDGFYDYHFLTSPDESIKGDYQIKGKGFDGFQDREIRGANILSLAQFALSNQLTAQFVKVIEFLRELARTRDIDPDKFFMTDIEIQQHQQAAMQQMMDEAALRSAGPAGQPAPNGAPSSPSMGGVA